MERRVLGWLPLDGSAVRTKDLFRRAAHERIAKTTVLRHLKEARRKRTVLSHREIANGRSVVTYRLALDSMFPYGDILTRLLTPEDATPEGRPGGLFVPSRPEDFVTFIEQHTDLLILCLDRLLEEVMGLPTERGARARALFFADYVLPQWLAWLAVAAWRQRTLGPRAIDEGMRRHIDVVAQNTDARKAARSKTSSGVGGS
jgi:hypothetical protein